MIKPSLTEENMVNKIMNNQLNRKSTSPISLPYLKFDNLINANVKHFGTKIVVFIHINIV